MLSTQDEIHIETLLTMFEYNEVIIQDIESTNYPAVNIAVDFFCIYDAMLYFSHPRYGKEAGSWLPLLLWQSFVLSYLFTGNDI